MWSTVTFSFPGWKNGESAVWNVQKYIQLMECWLIISHCSPCDPSLISIIQFMTTWNWNKSIDHFPCNPIVPFDQLKLLLIRLCQFWNCVNLHHMLSSHIHSRWYHFIFSFNSFHFISLVQYQRFMSVHQAAFSSIFFMVCTVYWASNTFIFFTYACMFDCVWVCVEITFTFYSPFIKLFFSFCFANFISGRQAGGHTQAERCLCQCILPFSDFVTL